jgi:hypothetical protein
MGYKNLRRFEFSKLHFLIFENQPKNNNNIFNICILFLKIKKSDLENSKHSKFLYPIRFQYEKFNENDKSKFGNHLIYFLS